MTGAGSEGQETEIRSPKGIEFDPDGWQAPSQGPGVELQLGVDSEGNDVIGMRNASVPGGAILYFTRGELDAWVKGAKAGEFDDMM